MSTLHVLTKLQSYMDGKRALLPVALVLSAMSTIAGMAPYILIWFIIGELLITAGTTSERIAVYAWWAAGTAVASIIMYFAALSCSHLAAFRAETNMRRLAMEKIVRMPLGFFNNNTSGRIRKIIDDNASITHMFLAHQLPDLAATVLMPVTVLVLIFVFDWRLGLGCLVPIIVSMVLMRTMMSKEGHDRLKDYMTSLEEMNTEAVEYVRGIPVVKVFQQTIYSFKNFHNSIIKYKELVQGYSLMWEKPMSAYTVIINSFAFFLVPVAILLIHSTGDYMLIIVNLFLYVLITPIFSQSIMRSMYLSQAFHQAREAVNRVENLTDVLPLAVATSPRQIKGHSIRFANVSFTYPGANNRAVDDVSFEIGEGQTIALVGASGSGKTTIARLVPRFWDTDDGAIYIGGRNVKDIDPRDLMSHVSFVFQNTRLFKATLLDNIRYGRPSATVDEIEEAVDMAQCREIIDRLPNGLSTRVGTEGTYLSGGEQQRIILARAMLKNAPIVILDEATAFADPENEHLIQKAFKKLATGKTVLMIAHRLTSVTSSDRILVMSEGRIIQQGTHKELLARRGAYARAWDEYQQSVKWTIRKEESHA